ncbi:serine/threonine-protein kinase [Isoptericola haloaureus]|uniref:Serine/threonine-protein kinase n=1 Tax=Isoptericola haloaureus TaxID=1542902 RepID=A0ABU7ZAW6_9MICO
MTPPGPAEESSGGHVVLGGAYVLGDILGTGGTYTVYEASRVGATGTDGTGTDGTAEDTEPLVIKVLHPHLVDDEPTRAALAREIAASDQVDHPGVAKVLDTGEDEIAGATVPWLLTRRLPGTTLAEQTPSTGLPWPEALGVAGGLLAALAAVHAAGLVHRDVSPRNVVVERHPDGTVQVGLIDLGLTAPGGRGGDGGTVVGSAAFMSPEQAQGRPLDARSDLYSVGALTYFALTGHAPYERAEPADVLRAHVGAPVPAPSARRAGVPTSVDRFVAQAMAKDPDRRFTAAGTMAAAAASVLGLAASAAAGAGADPDQTMSLAEVDAQDPDRTAALGAAGTTAALAAAAAAAASDAELQRTRQLGAVGAGAPGDAGEATGAAGAAAAVTGATPADPGAAAPDAPPSSARRWVPVALVALVLAVAAGAVVSWPLGDADRGDPVPVVTVSPSPTTDRTTPPRPDDPTTAPPAAPAPEPEPTQEPSPSPSPSPTPSDEPSPEPTTASPTAPEPDPTDDTTTAPPPTPDPDPTDDTTTAPAPAPEPTDDAPTAPSDAEASPAPGGSTPAP